MPQQTWKAVSSGQPSYSFPFRFVTQNAVLHTFILYRNRLVLGKYIIAVFAQCPAIFCPCKNGAEGSRAAKSAASAQCPADPHAADLFFFIKPKPIPLCHIDGTGKERTLDRSEMQCSAAFRSAYRFASEIRPESFFTAFVKPNAVPACPIKQKRKGASNHDIF